MTEEEKALQAQEEAAKAIATVKDATEIKKNFNALLESTKTVAEAMEKMAAAQVARDEEARKRESEDGFTALTEEKALKVWETLSDEKKNEYAKGFVEAYGEKNTEFALDKTNIKHLLNGDVTDRNPEYDKVKAFRKAYDDAYTLTAAWGGVKSHPRDSNKVQIDWPQFGEALKHIEKETGSYGPNLVRKALGEALDTVTPTDGLEWLPVNLSNNLIEEINLELRVAALFPRLTMTTKQFEIPVQVGNMRAYRMPEATVNTQFYSVLAQDHTPDSGKIAMIAQKLATLAFFSDELEQDAIVPVLEMLRRGQVFGMADGIEDAVINGDIITANTHLDTTAWTGTIDARGTWDGLRKIAYNGQAKFDFAGAPTLIAMRKLRKGMGKFGIADTSKLVYIISPESSIEILNNAEVLTLDKYGPGATVLTGELGKLDNIPIVVSPRMPTNLNAQGFYDGTTTTKTGVLLVRRDAYYFGDRQSVQVETDRNALAGQRFLLSTWRGDFKKLRPSTDRTEAYGFNVSP